MFQVNLLGFMTTDKVLNLSDSSFPYTLTAPRFLMYIRGREMFALAVGGTEIKLNIIFFQKEKNVEIQHI